MTPDSFSFGKYNSLDDWGVRVITYDVLLPPKRERKVQIPRRSGRYNYGDNVWDERTIRITCTLERKISRAQVREIAYALSQESNLVLWEEPDKYYIGEIYDPAEILDYFDECMRDFELTFICRPFAYSSSKTVPIASGNVTTEYQGTADAPCTIILRNNTGSAIVNPTIKFTYRR